MKIKTRTAVALGKSIHYATRILNIGGGSAAPGYYALKIDPELIANLACRIPKTVVITGTNGKTTTAKMLAQFAKAQGLKVIRNYTGSNLERGIASTLISNATHLHEFDLAVWELDEAAFNTLIPKIKPDMIVFLNVFRDQLDRYGEVDAVVKKWCQTLSKMSTDTKIFINGDDHGLVPLKDYFKGKVQTFGLESNKITGEKTTKQGNGKKLDFEAKNIKPQGLERIDVSINGQKFTLPVPGIYHVYNFLAAYILAKNLNISNKNIVSSLKTFLPAFGRVEKFDLGYIFLIKNPVGATQILQTLAPEIKSSDRLLLALNDNFADGTDVSWIWDSDWERLWATNYKGQIFCSGTRAEDMAIRLKYAGCDQKQIIVENGLERAFHEAREGLKGRLFVLSTYTALLHLQKILASKGLKKHYWKEAS